MKTVSESASPSQSLDDDPVLLQWVEDVKARLEAGEPIELEDYRRQDPARAERLHRLLPAMGMMADLARAPDPEPSPSFSPGSAPVPGPGTLGDFRIVREIGRGGMGVVYEAEQISLGRRVALKVLPMAAALDGKQHQRFQLEAHAAACLHHTNIVPVHAVGSERGVPFYAMQYIEGRSLAQLIAELRRLEGLDAIDRPAADVADLPTKTLAADLASGRLAGGTGDPADRDKTGSPGGHQDEPEPAMPASGPAPGIQAPRPGGEPPSGSSTRSRAYLRTVARLGVQVAEALDHAHTRGILHRDIKPGNLLLDEQGQLWVADFGLAQVQGQPGLTMTGDILGTLRYMSPEQALGRRVVIDGRTDVYSLGVTLYELLTLRPALDGRDRQEILRKIAQEEPAPPRKLNPAIPRDLETIVLKAIAKEPAERYATARELADELRRFLEDKPIRARRVGLGQRAILWARRRPAEAALAVVGSLAAVALIVTGMSLWYGGQLRRERDLARKFQYFQHIALANDAWREGSMGRLEELLDACPAEYRRHWEWHYLKRQCHAALLTLEGHRGGVYEIAYSPDGRRFASAGLDGTAKLWDPATGRLIRSFDAAALDMYGVAFSPDGARLATTAGDGSVKVWDMATGEELRSFSHGGGDYGWAVAFSRDGRRLAAAGSDGAMRVWDLATGRCETWRGGHTGPMNHLAYSPNGKLLASASWDGTAKIWDAATGRVIHTLTGHSDLVSSVAFSPDGQRLATASSDRTAKIWDAATGRCLRDLVGHVGEVWRVAFSRDGRMLVTSSGDPSVKFWDAATGAELLTIRGHGNAVFALAFSPDGTRLATSSQDRTVKFWEVLADPTARVLRGHEGVVNGIAIDPGGRLVASAGADRTVRIWEVASGRATILRGHGEPVLGVAFSPGGALLASADRAGSIRLWDVAGGGAAGPPLVHPGGEVPALAFHPDGEHLATAGSDGLVRVWSVRTRREVAAHAGHSHSVRSLAYSPDGRYLATGGEDRTVRVGEAKGDRLIYSAREHSCWVHSIAFSPDGRHLSSAGSLDPQSSLTIRLASVGGDGNLKIWDAASLRLAHTIRGHGNYIRGVAFSPDGTRLASASTDRTIKLWDVASGEEVLTLRGHTGGVFGVAFSPDGTFLASAGGDGTVRIWDARPWTPPSRE